MSPTAIDPLQVMREHTRAAHRQLETTPPVKRLMADDVRGEDLDRFLLLSHRYYTALEQHCGPALTGTPLYRRRTPALARTLAERGVSLTSVADHTISMPADDAATLLGVIYTVEGSSLGASSIEQHLRKHLAPDFVGAGYFRTFGRDSRSHWQQVITQLRLHLTDAARLERATEGALAVFNGLHALFQDPR